MHHLARFFTEKCVSMALPTRTFYFMVLIVPILLYLLYTGFPSNFDAQFTHFNAAIKGTHLKTSPAPSIKPVVANATLRNSSNIPTTNDTSNNSTIKKEVLKVQRHVVNLVPQEQIVSSSKKTIINKTTEKSSVILKIAPKPDNSSVDSIVQGVKTRTVYDSGFMIPNVELCPDFGKKLQVVIIITSAPPHADKRLSIRQTWGHFQLRKDVAMAFIVGKALSDSQQLIQEESELYGDIIQGNFVDSYSNLTLKTISMLEWVDNYCNKVKFVMKTDDDMFINIPKLIKFLAKHVKDKKKIFGRLAKKWKPIRNKSSKYYVSVQQYKPPIFPDFTTGPAYVLTNDIIHMLYTTALEKTYLKLEDVYTTGIVAQDCKIQRVHVNEFFNKRITLNPCNIQKGISIHMVKTFEQYDLWKKLLDGRSKC